MAASAPQYLHSCLAAFREVSERLYGWPFDLAAIENGVSHLQGRTLTYQDLAFFVAKERWWFEKFWVFPPEEKISPALAARPIDFSHPPKKQKRVITDLLDVFKSIELVSIVLRFVRPDAY